MNYKILLSASFIVLSLSAAAQGSATFAITGDGNGSFNWVNIRQLNIKTGTIEKTLFKNDNTAVTTTGVDKLTVSGAAKQTGSVMGFGVAAAAYDKIHNKLFFTPMHFGELNYLDLNAKEGSALIKTNLGSLVNRNSQAFLTEESHITRMDIAADGNGYAITNDGNHLIKFTTGKKTVITDLGALLDAESNKSISIHNRCTSWGGDIVSDAYGKLYIISASHNIFKVDIDSRTASYLGAISGLPANYTTNGAAVVDEDSVVVGSANSPDGFYKFNIKELAAVKIEGSDKYSASDLANGNLLYQKEVDAKRNLGYTDLLPARPVIGDSRVFPNPVTNNEFRVLFDNLAVGKYNIVMSDLSGKIVMSNYVTISSKYQGEIVRIANTIGKGVYFVKVLNTAKQMVFTEKVVVQ
jgi:hypothetical protein